MPIYEYSCQSCGLELERWHSVSQEAISECPECGGPLRRLISSGTGVIMSRSGHGRGQGGRGGSCSFEEQGRACCGRTERCNQSPCQE